MAQDRVRALVLSSFDTATASGTLQQMNTGGLDEACTFLHLVNNSSVDVLISFDGVNNHFFLQSSTQLSLPAQTNSQPTNYRQMFAKGMGVWVASNTGGAGTGSIYLSGLYALPL